MNFLRYKQILNIFRILILGIFIIGVESFTPKGRAAHNTALVGTKLYFFGGSIVNDFSSNEVFYLDVSQTFNFAAPPWTDLTASAKIPFGSEWGTVSLIDNNNDPIIYLFGGVMRDPISNEDTFNSNVHTFNVKTLKWDMPYINSKAPERRRSMHAVNDDTGKIYIFGGFADKYVGSTTARYFNDMLILDTVKLIWSYGSIVYVPNKRIVYSATLLTNGVIVYIGGLEVTSTGVGQVVDINQINLYDTKLDTWSLKIAKSTSLIESRYAHSAVLGKNYSQKLFHISHYLEPNGNIIIYGGAKDTNNIESRAEPDVIILNTREIPFEWSVPLKVSSNIGEMPSLNGHTANLIENYMIVAFGNSTITKTFNSKIYIMDISTYTWVDTFEVTSPAHSLKIVIGVLSGIIFLGIIGFVAHILRKKRREFQENIVTDRADTIINPLIFPPENQLALTNAGSSMIFEDSIIAQDTDDSESLLITRTENSNNSLQPSRMPTTNEFDIKSIPSSQSQNAFGFDFNTKQSKVFGNETDSESYENIISVNDKNNASSLSFQSSDDYRENIKFNNDLVELIPRLYRLLDLCKDDGSNGSVDKITISKEGLKNLCNDFVENSFKSVSEIDYNQLNSCSLRLIGCYGNHNLIAKLLLNKKLINHQLFEMLIHSSRQTNNIQETDNRPYLRPGIYFLTVNPELGLVIHWSEYGCYGNNTSSQRKKNMINLHRYLTKLTDCQICLMSEQDLNNFDWKKEEDQENFKIFSGFNISLPKIIKSEIKTLHPKVIESNSCQAFFTQKIITPPKTMVKGTAQIAKSIFNKEFMDKCGDCSVRINRSTMNLKMLEILVNHGLNMDDIKEKLDQCNEALNNAERDLVDKKEKEKSAVADDAKLLEILAYKRLNEFYGRLENGHEKTLQFTEYNEEGFTRLLSKYSDLESKLNQALRVNSAEWQNLKQRFIFGSLLLEDVHAQASKIEELDINDVNDAIWKSLFNMLNGFMYSTPCQIYKDYVKRLRINSSRTINFEFTNGQIKEYDNQTTIINSSPGSDLVIVDKLFNQSYFPSNSDLRRSIIELFSNRYNQWKFNVFPSNIRKITPQWIDYKHNIIEKLNREYEKQKQDIENSTFEMLCNSIEEKFPNGPLFNIIDITETSYWIMMANNYILTYEFEDIQPQISEVTIYETMLEQEDCLKIQYDEFHIPKPNLPTQDDGKYGRSFIIDPEVELRHISKFDHPKNPTYLIIIWNNKTNQMEFRFDTTGSIQMKTSKYCLIAVNESKGLIGIYDVNNVMLKVLAFDEDRTNLQLRANIQILEWYNNSVPDIKHFLFVKDTEELCFVEKSGRARIYNLVNGQFRASVSQFPPESTAILSTPDGSCIVAFVKSDNIISKKSFQSPKEVVKAYVYFCAEFGNPVNKVIEMPPSMQFLEFFQFSTLHKRQIHITTLDVNDGSLHSLIVKITRKKSLGQVKFESVTLNNEFIIIGRETNFIQDIEGGENIVIMGESYTVIEIISDERLRLVGNFSSLLNIGQWLDFHIKPKTKLNGLVDSYKLMFEKYPTDNCVDIKQNKPLNLHIVLDVLRKEKNIDECSTNFEDYMLDMFKDFNKEINKSHPILKEFSTFVTTFQEFDIENLGKKMISYQLGEWISCLIPIQIAVTENNQFQPLRDELLKTANDQPEIIDGYRPVESKYLGEDLAQCIPGLYRLLDLCKVDGSNSLANKTIISKDSLKKLCNDMVPLSFKSISKVNYTKLNSISFRLIGCYGNHTLMAKFLLNNKIINQQTHDLLIVPQSSMENTNKSSLRLGIYLLVVNSGLGLVIHWPEIGCYEENASLQHKNNMVNLHRYLTKLTDHQLCFMDDKDLERFDWKLNNPDLNSEDENETCYEFEVKKSREGQEDFKIHPGFKVNLSHIKTEMKDNIHYGIPMFPLVVGSTTNQSFITRKMAIKLNKNSLTFSTHSFSTEFHNILQGRSLTINRESMDMKQLKLLINSGLNMENKFFEQLYNSMAAAQSRMEKKIDQAKSSMEVDAEIITRMGWKKYFSIFEPMFQENNDDEIISEEEINRIQSRYPEVEEIMRIKIDSPAWIKLKQRYAFTYLIINQVYRLLENSGKEVTEYAVKEFYNMFVDEEADIYKLVEKYERRSQDFFLSIPSTVREKSTTLSNSHINQTNERCKNHSRAKSDSEFIHQDIIKSSFLGTFNDIKQDVLRAFLDEYQKWRKEEFPSNVRLMVPTFSFNKQLMDSISEEFSQEKEEIEACEFERICSELEKNYRDGPLHLDILNFTDNQCEESFCLTYKLETNQLQITIYETSLDKSDILQIQKDEYYRPNPILSSHYSTFHIDPTVYDFRKISQFDNCKFLLVLYNKKLQSIEILFDTAQQLAQTFKSDSIKPFKTLNADENFLIAINEPKELIAILDTRKVVLNVFSFSGDQANLYARNQNIQLLQWYNNTAPNVQHFLFIKGTEELCFVEKCGQARIFNLINQQFRPAVCILPPNTANVLSSPEGSCIVAFVKEKVDETFTDDKEQNPTKKSGAKEICRAYVYFCANFGGSVRKVIKLPSKHQSLESLQFTRINKLQTHLMSMNSQKGYFNSVIVTMTVEKAQYCFQKRIQNQSLGCVKLTHNHVNHTLIKGKNTHFKEMVQKGQNIMIMGEKYNVIKVLSDIELKVVGNFKSSNGFDEWMEYYIEPIEPKTKINDLIDVYKLMFEKYPVENCVDSEQNRPLSLKIVLDVDDDDIDEYSEKFEDYIIERFENLRRNTKKPASILKKFSTSVVTFQELDIKFQGKYPDYELGEWIIKLCCLVPKQIAVVRNNLFQPLMNDHGQVEFDNGYGVHVGSIAKNISFGWYEGILKHFDNKKVKVVSSMGGQSCEKSFMLNHLIGTSFDGICTDGVWMSLVNTKEYIYVALDFGNFKSSKRTPQEDVFLTLFNTIVSSLILFKNQFVVNEDSLSMFQRFQDGAMSFESGSKMPKAKLCVIIDVPKTDNDILEEFKSKFSQLVLEEGEDNFISRMYKGEVEIIPWPMINDTTWFKPLLNVSKKLVMQKEKYENARTFLQNTKVIMAKLKICDWSSLNETFMQIRAAVLNRLLPTAISYGLEQKDSVTEQLKNHDTGEQIDDPIVNLSDILHDLEKSTKLLPDSDIQLCDEDESFVQLSDYFNNNIQSRKGLSEDSKWFADFDRFLKYVIERRVIRVREWYAQNTAKFPKDNSTVINGKFELEQTISKFTLFGTLCGLTCQSCSLKCAKGRNHKESHDCLTDHKCHFLCDFIEVHDDELIPTCSHKAGHEGKHTCNKINHLCGKACVLIDKWNCQKVCSKEIGHDDDEHLCQSTLHYCGKDCSLSTYTQKGDYRCPNRCIIPYDEEHDLHRCENKTCPVQCPILGCQRICQSNDHLHSYSDLHVDHFCGDEHPCQEFCEEAGVCKIITVPKQQITFTKYTQSDERSRCNKIIPPNEFKHTGKHTHDDGFHSCDAKCQFCGNYCTLPYGHTQIHETRHGIMTQNEFDEFEYAGYKLRDQEAFVLCNLHCKDLGGHRHVNYCPNEENCKLGNQRHDIQHIDERVQPHPDKPKDFISHKLLWERTGFKDPYSVQEQQEFAKIESK